MNAAGPGSSQRAPLLVASRRASHQSSCPRGDHEQHLGRLARAQDASAADRLEVAIRLARERRARLRLARRAGTGAARPRCGPSRGAARRGGSARVGSFGIRPRERAEAAERLLGSVLVELARPRRRPAPRRPSGTPRGLRRTRAPPTPAGRRAGARRRRAAARARRRARPRAQRLELARGRELRQRRRRGERRDERGQPAREVRVEQVPGDDRVRRVRLGLERGAPCLHRIALVRPQAREAEMELDDRDLRVELRELLEAVERPLRPRGERRADLRLERVVLREERRRLVDLPALVERRARARDPAPRRPPGTRARTRAAAVPRAARARSSSPARRPSRRRRRAPPRRRPRRPRPTTAATSKRDPTPGRHRRTIAVEAKAIVPKVMATYRELLAQVRGEIDEISTIEAHERLDSSDEPALRRRPRARRVGRGPHPRRDLHRPRPARAARSRASCPTRRARSSSTARPDRARPSPRRRSRSSATTNVVEPRRRVRRLEAERLRGHDPARPLARAALALQPPPAHPRGRRGRAAAPARRARPPHRRRRARLARVALPRSGRRRHARHRRRGRRRRVEPPAPDRALDRPARRAEGRAPRSGRSRRSTRT